MAVIANDETNAVDNSITFLKESIPEQIRFATALYFKYGKIISEKFDSLSKSDEIHRIRGMNDINSVLSLTFDKLIYLFDKDLYIDFINELDKIPNKGNYYSPEEDYFGEKKDVFGSNVTANIPVEYTSFKYTIHPFTGLSKLANKWNVNKTIIPMIKAIPKVIFRNRIGEKYRNEGGKCKYSLFSRDVSPFDISPSEIGINIEMSIDIESLFETIDTLARFYTNKNKYIWNSFNNNIIKDMKNFSDEEIAQMSNLIIENLIPRVFYSASTTYLACVSKLTETRIDFFSNIANDILNSCRETVSDDYDSNGDHNSESVGSVLRNMSLNISDIINSILNLSYSNEYDDRNSHLRVIKSVLEYLFSLKYETYNFIKVPSNNLKQKMLTEIGKLAKLSTSYLSKDNKIALSLAYTHQIKELGNISLSNFFLPLSVAKVEGIYAINKRLYDCGKDFVDVFAKFIIIKKRMADVAQLNFRDGSLVDRIGKNYTDYRSFLTYTYKELKNRVTILSERIKSIIKGRNNLKLLTPSGSKEDSIMKDVNTIIYGITAETIPGLTVDYFNASDSSIIDSSILDNDSDKKIDYPSYNTTIKDINLVYKYLNTHRESKYLSNSNMSEQFVDTKFASLIDSWRKINETLGNNILDLPYTSLSVHLSMVIHDSMNYGITSINEMTPNVDQLDPSVLQCKPYDFCSCGDDSNVTGKGNISDGDIYSVEELRERFENFKKSVEEYEEENGDEDLFGLFNDYMGVPCGRDITAKEIAVDSKLESGNPNILSSENFLHERDEFIKLKKEYDKFIASKF